MKLDTQGAAWLCGWSKQIQNRARLTLESPEDRFLAAPLAHVVSWRHKSGSRHLEVSIAIVVAKPSTGLPEVPPRRMRHLPHRPLPHPPRHQQG